MDGGWTVPGYRHVRPLGEGASGKVMLAVHEATRAPVAIKYLSERLRTDEDFLRRFRAEARLMARLDDPHVVRFYEYAETPGSAALVMELVDGVTLKDVIIAEGATGPEAALLVLKGSLLGLAAAHGAGVVHRDYKPANVLVDDHGHSKLADFGIAVRAGDEVGASGTPAYMAPEQWTTGAVSAATDVYAATAVCYECLTGERPFPVKGHWALAAAHRSGPVPVERVPRPLRELIAYGMAKNPDDRPRSAAVFLEELEEVALAAYGPGWEERGRVRLAALAALLASLFPLAGSPPGAGTALALTRLGRRRVAMAAGALVAAVVAGGGGAAVLAGVHRGIGAHTSATSSPVPVAEPSTPPADSPSASPSASAGPETTGPTTASPAGGTSAAPSPATTLPRPLVGKDPPKTPPTKVTALQIGSFTLAGTVATAQVTVTLSGPGKVTVSADFSEDTPAAQVATASDPGAQTVSGSGPHDLTFTHDYGERCPAARVTVTTSLGGTAEAKTTCQPE
ncbi:serine/threonine protein kinase [Actinoallomurus sp. NBC_01490]|uniref:protein kinase domain-containing protein n=1 Tax=Actinoallomurus sp. NBC_01490 TaxID=2903557 RepID=UPI002E340C53|nr:protein kinase [Actinoallomurus sp. NBC_01490]